MPLEWVCLFITMHGTKGSVRNNSIILWKGGDSVVEWAVGVGTCRPTVRGDTRERGGKEAPGSTIVCSIFMFFHYFSLFFIIFGGWGNTNTHGKIGGQKVVTSASVYVRMGRLTSVFLGFYWSNSNTQNLIPIAMCQFKDRFLTKH